MLLTFARFCCGPSWKSARPRESFESSLRETVEWYLGNRPWWERIRAKGYRGERLGVVA
jgi:dTDP-D-glucose 4,6-dehydratase